MEVKITEMYKADGSSSNYTRLYVRLGSSGQQASQKLLKKGNWTSFTVDKAMHILEQQSTFMEWEMIHLWIAAFQASLTLIKS